ncbi:MAG: hypothetical protein R3F65_20355 [bacterium]|nr:hypothetical protein [Myxococcales bacterium]MCB9543473.1 hypothetical protein [Myxococcales bacterium]MCB9551060.1 hypothetical protein [Myxococcales bacterium]
MTRTRALALAAAWLIGCGDGDLTLEEADPAAAPAAPTWTDHVAPIIELHCVACHDPDGLTGAAEGVAYDTCEATRRNWRELEETVFEEGEMPPGGAMRLRAYEELILRRWHEQGARCD